MKCKELQVREMFWIRGYTLKWLSNSGGQIIKDFGVLLIIMCYN